MKVDTYLKRLKFFLWRMNPEEKDDVIAYYREIFEEAGEEREEELIKEFGPPRRLAAEILADNYENVRQETGKPVSPWKMIFIILIALPVGIPLLLIAFLLAFLLIGTVLLLAFLLVLVDACLALFAVLSSLSGLMALFKFYPVGLFYLGLGITGAGIFILLTRFLIWLFPWSYIKLKSLYLKAVQRLKKYKNKGKKNEEVF